jgi:hypothetical protein
MKLNQKDTLRTITNTVCELDEPWLQLKEKTYESEQDLIKDVVRLAESQSFAIHKSSRFERVAKTTKIFTT